MTPGTPILNPLFSRNFGGLVLVCIEADFCDQGIILQHFSRSTKCTFLRTGRNSILIAKFRMKFCWFFRKNQHNFIRIFAMILEFRPVRRNVNFVDLEKCCKMRPWSQKSASMQKRTSPPKFLENRGSRMGVPWAMCAVSDSDGPYPSLPSPS